MEIGDWLRGLGLALYEQSFRENGIDFEVLPQLTVEDLKEIGVQAVGHRRKILDAISLLPAQPPARQVQSLPERRHLTLMFVDLVGSTDISRRLDPEELRDLMRAYQNTVAGEIVRLDGHVAKFFGDGVLAYFGWPRAREDAAERAVRAGLRVAKAVEAMSPDSGHLLETRIGIATGLVVVGDLLGEGAAKEENVSGETPNLAARLQQVAEPGAVVIAESTRRLIGDLFELEGLSSFTLKGFSEPVRAWRVVGEGSAESRFEALHGARMTPLVGRDEELHLMLSRWRLAEGRAGQVVLISGEPGIGKSRLTMALREKLQIHPIKVVTYACSPQHTNSALFPFISQIERAARFASDDASEKRLARLETLLSEEDASPGSLPLFADLLGVTNPTSSAGPDLSPQQRKALLFRAFMARFERITARGPVLIVLEDAHWLDPTSRELFDQIVSRLHELPVLLVVTFRPDVPAPWIGSPYVMLLTLNRLQQAQAITLVDRITGGKGLPAEVLEQILARTEGVPLFTEELTKAVLEGGILRDAGDKYVLAGPLPPVAIPATLHDSLMARLDRLAPVKEVAQIGACIGREFDHELLAAIVSMSEPELATALDRLLAAELIFRQGVPPAATYVFKHALVRDAAYESLLKRRRQELHAQIAASIEARFPRLGEAQPELVARHFSEAGLAEQAGPYWLQAGRHAANRSANKEAIAHLKSGLECARAVPPGESRLRLELALQLGLGAPLIATKGFASREVEAAYRRAEELSRELGSEPDLLLALRGLTFVYHVRANLRGASRLVEETARLMKRSCDAALHVEADHSAGALTFHLGEFQPARDVLERAAHAGGYGGRYHSEIYGINIGVFARAYMSHCDWHLGYPVRALALAEEGLALAREISHPFSVALALNYLAMLHQFAGNPGAALRAATESGDICAEHGFDYYRAWSNVVRAWAIAKSGEFDQGLASYDAALDDLQRTSAGIRMPHYLRLLASLHREAGKISLALQINNQAIAIAADTDESWCNAELHRQRGELMLLGQGANAASEADAAFQIAIETASRQGAKLPELRASTARARLLAIQGRRQEARDMLAPIYGWFSEGFDTRYLMEARALLEDLSTTSEGLPAPVSH